MDKNPPPWGDISKLYTRQDIVGLTGIDDEVLGYWVKRRLLLHAEGGEGKGAHRKYHFSQINIAVILGAFRDTFGANIATLSSLAATLQDGTKLFLDSRVRPGDWWKVGTLGRALHAFRNGEEVMIDAHHWSDPDFHDVPESAWIDRRPANSEAEIIARELAEISSHPGAAIKLAERLGPTGSTRAAAARITLGTLLDPRTYSDVSWLLLQSGSEWRILEGLDGQFTDRALTQPGIFLPVSLMVRKVWDMPSGGYLINRDILKRFNLALKEAGIDATVRFADDGKGRGFIAEPEGAVPDVQRIGMKLGLGRADDMDKDYAARFENIYWTPEDDAEAPE